MIIYYVEDNKELGEIMGKYLAREGYDVTIFANGEAAMKKISDKVDLWVLDIMLPGDIDGFQLIDEIHKRRPDVPVIFTSARDQDIDKVMGLEKGSDDYLAKPFSPKELVLRIKAILKRKQSGYVHNVCGYIVDVEKRNIKDVEGNEISLTNKEFDMLSLFVSNHQTLLTRQQLLKKIWDSNDTSKEKLRVVDDLLRRLRNKLPNLRIETIYGKGYKLL